MQLSKKKNIDLFNVLKINTSLIMSNGCNVVTTYKDAKRNGMVVSLGDNQLLRFIRKIREKTYDKDKVDNLYEKRNYYKSLPESKENLKTINSIQSEIDELLFVPDLVVVKTDTTKKDGIKYEIEYLIAGKDSEKENLGMVFWRMITNIYAKISFL